MTNTRMPYQCLEKCGNILLAARGSSIDSFSLENGSLLSTWTCPYPSTKEPAKLKSAPREEEEEEEEEEEAPNLATQTLESSSVDITINASSPPAERRKLSSAGQGTEKEELEQEKNTQNNRNNGKPKQGKKKQNNRSDAVACRLGAPAVIALTATKGGEHVIAVTGEDKSIRVFKNVLEEGQKHKLKQISLRAMPKRPCAIAITPDSKTIISADKFGDVYSLPLIPSEPPSLPESKTETPELTAAAKSFIPAANELTIHSQRNRKALENQRRQTNKAPEKAESSFEHKVLLGHVSMLTDVALATVGERTFILTADRDEHIRVSRGIPQTHIIEGFCLGHKEFITRLCVLRGYRDQSLNVLISGGGDDELYVWQWQERNLISKVDLKRHVAGVLHPLGTEEAVASTKIAVSGLYSIKKSTTDDTSDFLIVTCEGVPALFTFVLTPGGILKHIHTLHLPGNALAVAETRHELNTSATNRLAVSVDAIQKPGSTIEQRGRGDDAASPLLTYDISQDGKLVEVRDFAYAGVDEDKKISGGGSEGRLTNLLYNLDNLRKREEDGKVD